MRVLKLDINVTSHTSEACMNYEDSLLGLLQFFSLNTDANEIFKLLVYILIVDNSFSW